MNRITQSDATRMVRILSNLHDDIGRFLNECGSSPFPNSQAAKELSSFRRPESLTTAFNQGSALIEVAGDHLMALTKTLTEPVQTVSPWTCVRAIIESCALASWLLEPIQDPMTRVQRSFAFRYKGLTEQIKFGRAAGKKGDTAKTATRIDEVERVALELGFSRVENQRGKRIGIAQQMPKITDIVNQLLDEEAIYRLLSAMTHAHHWALQQLSFQKVNYISPSPVEKNAADDSISRVVKKIEPISVAFLCFKATHIFARPIWHKCKLFGWDVGHLRNILDATFDRLGVFKESHRFWRCCENNSPC